MPLARPPISRTVLVVRTVLWIVISSIFLVASARRVLLLHAAGINPGWWNYAQLGVWSAGFLFWLLTAWRDWTRRVS